MDKEKAIKILNLNEYNYKNVLCIKKSYYKLSKNYYFKLKFSKVLYRNYYNLDKKEKDREIDNINSACIFLLFLNAEEDKRKKRELNLSYYSVKESFDKLETKIVNDKICEEIVKDIENEYRNYNIYWKTICNLIIWLIFLYKSSKNKRKSNFLILRFAFYSLISIHLNFLSLILLFIIEAIIFCFYHRKDKEEKEIN